MCMAGYERVYSGFENCGYAVIKHMSKYIIRDHPELFEFHDSETAGWSSENGNLILDLKHLNVHKEALGRQYSEDMEIENAQVRFEAFHMLSMINDEGNGVINECGLGLDCFFRQLDAGICIYSLEKNSGIWMLTATGELPCFSCRFTARCFIVQFDSLASPAWYTND